MEEDRGYMRRALGVASQGVGITFPSTAVGCVIVKRGQVIGEGFHPKAGKPHAEVYALRAAGQEAQGATAYVTLEPCNHYGRTPPCSKALVEVVVGVVDPNPLVKGQGIETLETAGVEVVTGCLEEECTEFHREFIEGMNAS